MWFYIGKKSVEHIIAFSNKSNLCVKIDRVLFIDSRDILLKRSFTKYTQGGIILFEGTLCL